MEIIDWEQIKAAIQSVATSNINRIDGDNWTVYRVGSKVRIDIGIKS